MLHQLAKLAVRRSLELTDHGLDFRSNRLQCVVGFQPPDGHIADMYQRNIVPMLREALRDTPVVLLNGARQTGKSTLVGSGVLENHEARYLTLDEAGVLAAAEADPAGFLSALRGPVILDEVQRSPGLFPAIKAEVDRDRRPGRFLLTGSAYGHVQSRVANHAGPSSKRDGKRFVLIAQ